MFTETAPFNAVSVILPKIAMLSLNVIYLDRKGMRLAPRVHNLSILIILIMLLVACASNERKAPETEEIFVTNIESNRLKLFSYTIIVTIPPEKNRDGNMKGMHGNKRGRGMRTGKRRNTGSNQISQENRIKKIVYKKLEEKLRNTGYCREGFVELDSYFMRGRAQIRGECKEAASKTDREKFINRGM